MYLGQCLQMQSNLQDGVKVGVRLKVIIEKMLTLSDCPRPVPPVQTDRTPVLQFFPLVQPDVSGPVSSEGRHGSDC
jgi:hypothetical protein